MRRLLFLIVSVVLLSFVGAVAQESADERILSFKSRIEVHRDASIMVTETIVVRALGHEIKRGIYRDFPTSYTDRFGKRVRVGFRVLDVMRDGRSEPYHIRDESNGKRVYIGDKDVFLEPDVYSYTLTYATDRQLGFYDNYDLLHWRVTGNGWTFPIDQAEARVILPEGAHVLGTFGYTGYEGDAGGDYNIRRVSAGEVIFSTTRSLRRSEGLTIAVSWPKGIVTESKADL